MTKQLLGKIIFFITWPGIYLIIKLQPPRSRVVILAKGKILLVKDWLGTGKWSLPGGGIKRSEDPVNGAIREVKEETGLLLPAKLVDEFARIEVKSSGIKFNVICFIARIEKTQTPDVTSLEIAESKWVNFKSLDKLNISSSTKQVLRALSKRPDLLK